MCSLCGTLGWTRASQALHGVDMRTAKQKREAGDQPPAEVTHSGRDEILSNLL